MDTTSLRGHPLLGRIDPPLWAWTLEASDLLTVARGGVVYGPGRFRRCLGVVLRGRIEVRRESILMAALSAGDVFGAAALFNDSPDYPTTLTALSPCQTLLIPETRVRALLRRAAGVQRSRGSILTAGGITLNTEERSAARGETPVDLTAKEYDLIELLMRNPRRVYSRENLMNVVWGYSYAGDYRTVDVHIRRLREKLEENPAEPDHIMTKWGVGYYFKE